MTLLPRYLTRIGFAGPTPPTLATVAALHRGHVDAMPFENLDVLAGRAPSLRLDDIVAKMVDSRRGGYCFEQNTLFAAVLRQLGVSVTLLMARVRFGTKGIRGRTHVLLRVEVEGRSYIADVGFGGWGLAEPLRLDAGVERFDGLVSHRLMKTADVWTLQVRLAGAWRDLYAFTLEPNYPADLDMANHYTATHPDSPFVRHLLIQRIQPHRRLMLREDGVIELTPAGESRRRLSGQAEILGLLTRDFALAPPPGLSFPYI